MWSKPGAEETSHQLVVGIVIKMHPPIIKKSKKQFSPGLGQSTEPVRISVILVLDLKLAELIQFGLLLSIMLCSDYIYFVDTYCKVPNNRGVQITMNINKHVSVFMHNVVTNKMHCWNKL